MFYIHYSCILAQYDLLVNATSLFWHFECYLLQWKALGGLGCLGRVGIWYKAILFCTVCSWNINLSRCFIFRMFLLDCRLFCSGQLSTLVKLAHRVLLLHLVSFPMLLQVVKVRFYVLYFSCFCLLYQWHLINIKSAGESKNWQNFKST